jgi:AraC-like DNA-binding protein
MSDLIHFRAIGRIRPEPAWSMPLHRHPHFHELLVVLAGRIETRIAGQTLIGLPGDALFYPRGQPHAEQSTGGKPLETLFLSWTGTPKFAKRLPLLHHDRSGRITTAVTWMEDLQLHGEGQAKLFDGLLEAVLHELNNAPRAPQERIIAQAQRHVREHLSERLCLADLAEQAGLSPWHFARLFKRGTGQAPMAFVRRARIDAARALLQSTPLPLRAIAQRVGLGDAYQLSRIFKRVTGIAPSAMRRPSAGTGRA